MCFFINALNTRLGSGSKVLQFQIDMHENCISWYLQQLQCDTEVSVATINDKSQVFLILMWVFCFLVFFACVRNWKKY